jgi:voltage-gated potassium channel
LDEPEANINSVGDGLWWAVAMLTTVGYGDRFPTSPMGKVIAVVLMLVDVALLRLLAANLASIQNRGLRDEPESTRAPDRRDGREVGADGAASREATAERRRHRRFPRLEARSGPLRSPSASV